MSLEKGIYLEKKSDCNVEEKYIFQRTKVSGYKKARVAVL